MYLYVRQWNEIFWISVMNEIENIVTVNGIQPEVNFWFVVNFAYKVFYNLSHLEIAYYDQPLFLTIRIGSIWYSRWILRRLIKWNQSAYSK